MRFSPPAGSGRLLLRLDPELIHGADVLGHQFGCQLLVPFLDRLNDPAVLGTGILCFVPTFGEERHFVSDDSFFLSAAPSESVWEKTDNAIGRSLMARPNTKLSCLFFLTEVE